MKILLSGSTGLIGSALFSSLPAHGHQITRLIRKGTDGIVWNPATGAIDTAALEGFDAVIHLAGESIASGRWTDARKQEIRDSRVRGTKVLVDALARLKQPPHTFICASAIGYYGNRSEERLPETSSAGSGFLAELCQAWEAAAASASQKGMRVVHLRFGVVLSPKGGALGKMLLPFKLGLGGKIGSGDQYLSWVCLDEIPGVVQHILTQASIEGPVNVVSPNPVSNSEFTHTLGRVLSRPTILPMPAFAAKLAFGEMADEMLLASQRVEPAVLSKTGFRFAYLQLEGTLQHLLA